MSFKVLNKQLISPTIKRLDIHAPAIAARAQPGQFVMVAPDRACEPLALPIAEQDRRKASVAFVFQANSPTALKLGDLQINDEVEIVMGPLGTPVRPKKFGTVLCMATSLGTAPILPIARGLKDVGNKVIGILGAPNRRTLLFEPQMRMLCHKIHVATKDGSYMKRGLASDLCKDILKTENIQAAFVAGSISMMQTVSALTKAKNIPTFAYLNPIMLDGNGFCGSCRVKVGGRTVLACQDGPVFDAHQVDFDALKIRVDSYKPEMYNSQPRVTSWDNQPSQLRAPAAESRTLTKWLSGIRKK